MRLLVRFLGLGLVALGLIFWARSDEGVPAQTPHSASLTAASPASSSQPEIVSPPANSSGSQPAAPPPVAPKSQSATIFLQADGASHVFEVTVHRDDGWYDTGIPVTVDVHLTMSCSERFMPSEPACTRSIQAMIGGHVFEAPYSSYGYLPLGLDVIRPGFTSTPEPGVVILPQQLTLPEDALETLRLRNAAGEDGTETVPYKVKVFVPSGVGGGSVAQQRELDALHKMEAK